MRVKCMLAYDGTDFSGFQYQPNERTIAGELEKALKKIHKGEEVRIHGSGRTDAGVHAQGQVFHFDTSLQIPPANWKRALNTLLPDDIHIKAVKQAEEGFHARYSAVAKEYHYYVQTTPEPNVFKRKYMYHYPRTLDIEKMRQACDLLQGTHDFTTFSSAKTGVKGSKIRTLYEITVKEVQEGIYFRFYGDGFLYNMVRIFVSVLLDVGSGKRQPEDMLNLIAQKDRQAVGKTMPPQGLFLFRVEYE